MNKDHRTLSISAIIVIAAVGFMALSSFTVPTSTLAQNQTIPGGSREGPN
jgi:hypothetical protein